MIYIEDIKLRRIFIDLVIILDLSPQEIWN